MWSRIRKRTRVSKMLPGDITELAEKLDGLEQAVALLGSRREKPAPTIQIFRESQFASGVFEPFTWSVRMRWKFFQVVSDVFDRFTLQIGTATYRFATNDGVNGRFDLPFVIDAGVTVRFFPDAAGNVFVVYVVAYADG